MRTKKIWNIFKNRLKNKMHWDFYEKKFKIKKLRNIEVIHLFFASIILLLIYYFQARLLSKILISSYFRPCHYSIVKWSWWVHFQWPMCRLSLPLQTATMCPLGTSGQRPRPIQSHPTVEMQSLSSISLGWSIPSSHPRSLSS